jgi:hypothetical protein
MAFPKNSTIKAVISKANKAKKTSFLYGRKKGIKLKNKLKLCFFNLGCGSLEVSII